MSITKNNDPSDLSNLVNGFDVEQCFQLKPASLIISLPNYGYGLLSNIATKSSTGGYQSGDSRSMFSYTHKPN